MLVGNRRLRRAPRPQARARIKATAKIGTDPTIMLTGPVPVTEKILREAGMAIRDLDLFEVNEAFAAVVLRFMQAFDVDPPASTSTAAPSPWATRSAPPAR